MSSARAQASARKEILRSAVGSVVESLERRQLLASVAINFQTSGTSTPSGYLADSGATYANRGNGYSYGWNTDNSANTSNDGAIIMVDTPYKTYAKMQPGGVNRTWEIGLANGSYQVKVVAGDYQNSTSVYDVRVEGQQGPSGAADPYTHWFEKTVVVNVNDGKLTISNGSNASDQRIAFVQITDVASLSIPSTTAANLVARAASNTAIDLVWDDTTNNEYGFEVQRKLGSGSFTTIATVGGGNEYWNFNTRAFYNDTGLTSGAIYTYRVRPVNAAGTPTAWSNEAMVDLPATNAQAAYNNGVARPVTSRIEAEDFDIGGPAFGYTDNSTGNYADLYRRADVDVGTYSGGYFVGWNSADEWTAYTVSVPVSGTYDLTFARSRGSDGGTFQILQDGARVGPESIQFIGTGNAFTFATTTVGGFYLNAGTHILTLKILTTPSGSGEAGNIDWLQFNLVTEGVAQPTNLSAPSVTASSVQLTWTDNASNETSYTVQRKIGTGAWATLASGLPANTATYTDNTVSAGSNYSYQVIAVSTTLGSSAASNSVAVTTPSNTTQYTLNPSADSYVRGSSTYENDNYGTAQELLTKLISSSNKTNHRETFFKFDTSGQTGNVTSAVLRVFGRRHTLVGTDPNPINFEFRAVQNTTWTESGITYANKPTIGTTVLGTVGLSSTTDQWYEVDITSYLQQERAAGRNTVSIAVVGTYSGSDAAFYIKSKEHANKPQLVIQTQAVLNPPSAPTTLAGTSAPTQSMPATVSLTWADNANNETGYRVERKLHSAGVWSSIANLPANSNSYTDTTVLPDMTYDYRVCAVNADGDSGFATLSGVATPPAPPTDLAGSASASSASLSWTDVSDTETEYRVEYRRSNDATDPTYHTVADAQELGPNASSYSLGGLQEGTQYDIRVRAINAASDGFPAGPIQPWTKLATPTNVSVTHLSSTSMRVAWTDNSTKETSYVIEYTTDSTFATGITTKTESANATFSDLTGLAVGAAYFVRLRAVNPNTESEYWSGSNNPSGQLSITRNPVGLPNEGSSVTLNAVYANGAPQGTTYTWAVTRGGQNVAGGTGASLVFTATDNGVYEVSLNASNGDVATHSFTVVNVNPTATISGVPSGSVNEGSQVNLTVAASDAGTADTFTYAWTVTKDGQAYSLPSGTVTNGTSFSFVPRDNGTYIATVSVTDDDGGSFTVATGPITADNVAPVAGITGTPAGDPDEGDTVYATATVTDDGEDDTHTYAWSVTKDGEPYDLTGVTPNAATFAFVPNDNGDYVISLTVSDDEEATDTTTSGTITVNNLPPLLTITGDTHASQNATVTLGSEVVDRGSADTHLYLWSLTLDGQPVDLSGATVNQPGFSFVPTSLGTYVATLTVTDDDGDPATATQQFVVSDQDPPPGAPSGLAVASAGIAAMQLNWQVATGDVDGYAIERSVDGGDWEEIDVVYGNALSYTDHAFVMNASLKYQIRAFNSFGYSSYSNEAPFVTGTGGLSTPSAVSATVLGTSAVQLGWSDTSSNEAGYLVEVDAGSGFLELARTLAGANSYVATGLTDGTTYMFRVSAVAAFGTSDAATSNTITTSMIAPAPLLATSAGNAAGLSWNDLSANETYFKIQYRAEGGEWQDAANAVAGATSASITGLEYDTKYEFRVRSANADTQSSWTITTATTAFGTPVISFSGEMLEGEPIDLAVEFDGEEPSVAPSYSWTVSGDGDLSDASSSTPTFTPADDGNFIATLQINYASGLTQTLSQDVQVDDVPPTASISGSDTTEISDVFVLALEYSDVDADPAALWTIDWGDGSAVEMVAGGEDDATHAYVSTGNFTIRAKVLSDGRTYHAGVKSLEVQSPESGPPLAATPATYLGESTEGPAKPTLTIEAIDVDSMVLHYSTVDGARLQLEVMTPGDSNFRRVDMQLDSSNEDHSITFNDLVADMLYSYRIRADANGLTEYSDTKSFMSAETPRPTIISVTPAEPPGDAIPGEYYFDVVYDVPPAYAVSHSVSVRVSSPSDPYRLGGWDAGFTGALDSDGHYHGTFIARGHAGDAVAAFTLRQHSGGFNEYGTAFETIELGNWIPNAGPVLQIETELTVDGLVSISWQFPDYVSQQSNGSLDAQPDGLVFWMVDNPAHPTSFNAVGSYLGFETSGAFAFEPGPEGSMVFGVVNYGDPGTLFFNYSNFAPADGAPMPAMKSTSLEAFYGEGTGVRLLWNNTPNEEDEYEIQRSIDGVVFDDLATASVDVSSYVDATTNTETTYWYRVRPVNGARTPGFSNLVVVRAITAPELDLDVDSNNDGFIDLDNKEGFGTDDPIEATTGTPGQIISIDDGDEKHNADGDTVPDFADALNANPNSTEDDGSPLRLSQFRLSIPESLNSDELDEATFRFDYLANSPETVIVSGGGTAASPYVYSLDPEQEGNLRIWAIDPEVDSSGILSADQLLFLAPGIDYAWSNLADKKFYVQAVKPTVDDEQRVITAALTVDPSGDPVEYADTVRVTASRFDLDVITTPTSTGDPQVDRSDDAEDSEDDLTKPGQVIVVNDADRDADGVRDLADGFNAGPASADDLSASTRFSPMLIEVPLDVDLTKAALALQYSASDPRSLQNLGTPGSPAFAPAEGTLRVWTKDGNVARSKENTLVGAGDYVGIGEYSGEALARLPVVVEEGRRYIKLWVEGVRASAGLGDQLVTASLRLDRYNEMSLTLTDSARFTILQAKVPEARDSLVSTADGSFRYESRDFDLAGWTDNFGMGRLFTDAPEYVLSTGNDAAATVSEWPRLVNAGSSMVVLIGGTSYYFDLVPGSPNSSWKARFNGREKLTQSGGDFKFVSAGGETWVFDGFGESLKSLQRGQFKQYLSAGGQSISVTANDGDGRITKITRGGVELTYAYKTSGDSEGELETVTAKRGATVLYEVTYTYYAKNDSYGNAHDVKTAIVKMGSTDVEKKRFFYAKTGTEQRSVLSTVIEGRDYARAVGDGLDPATAAPAALYGYASFLRSGGSVYTPQTGTISLSGGANPVGAVGTNAWSTWQVQTVGNLVTTVFSNSVGQPMIVAQRDAASKETRFTHYRYNVKGLLEQEASRLAVESYDQTKLDLVNYTSATSAQYLRDNAGLIVRYAYNDDNLIESESIRNGESGSNVKLREYEYASVGVDSIKHPSKETSYVTVGQDPVTRVTSYSYPTTAHNLPTEIKTTRADDSEITKKYNAFGRLEYFTDADGFVHHTTWDNEKGVATSQVVDEGQGGLGITTSVTESDAWGRPKTVVDPLGRETRYTYVETATSRTVTATHYGLPAGSGPVLRVSEVLDSWQYGFVQTVSKSPSGTIISATRSHQDHAGRPVQDDRYFSIPAGDPTGQTWGSQSQTSESGNFHRTTYGYDAFGRLVTSTDAVGVTRSTDYDSFGRPIADKVGGETVRSYRYVDDPATGTGFLITTSYPGTSSPRYTTDYYDWRGRTVASENGVQLVWRTFNNADEQTVEEVFDNSANQVDGVVSGVQVRQDAHIGRVAQTSTDYNALGLPVSVKTHAVSTNGSVSAGLEATYTYDGRGNPWVVSQPGGLVTTTLHDGAGRPFYSKVGSSSSPLEENYVTYDAAGNATLTRSVQHAGGYARVESVANWYDGLDRTVTTVNYGKTALGFTRPSSPPARTAADANDSNLRIDYSYAQDGTSESVTDARGIVASSTLDALGRAKRVYRAFGAGTGTDANRRTDYVFDGRDRTIEETEFVEGVGRTTRTQYASPFAEGPTTVILPPPPYTAPPQSYTDSYAYNRLGELIRHNSRLGPSHEYSYDSVGRMIAEQVNVPAMSQVDTDSRVNRRETKYDVLNRPYLFSGIKRIDSTAQSPQFNSIVTQVRRVYDSFGNVIADYQEAKGAVNANTRAVRYEYDLANNGSRLKRMIYPTTDAEHQAGQGRSLWYGYASGIDSSINRVSYIADAQAGGTQTVESYTYLGLSRVVGKSRPLNDSANDNLATTQTNATDFGLDQFGRTSRVTWASNGTPVYDQQSWYDANSNVLAEQDHIRSNLSELYHAGGATAATAYDNLNQISHWARGVLGTLNGAPRPNAITGTPVDPQSWTITATGVSRRNMPPDNEKMRPIFQGDYDASRMEDKLDAFVDGNPELASNPPTQALAVKFDAFGNLVRLEDWSMLYTWTDDVAKLISRKSFAYDALGRRLNENYRGSTAGRAPIPEYAADYYYDLAGNVIEDRVYATSGNSVRQYVWSPADGQLVLRDRGTERVYALSDMEGNVAAITNASGQVLERYAYSPEGKLTIFDDAATSTRAASNHGWQLTFKSGRRDAPGIYHTSSGEWDYLTGSTLRPDSLSYWDAALGYSAPSVHWGDKAVLIAVPIVVGVATAPFTGGMSLWAAGAIIGATSGLSAGFINGYAAGRSGGQLVGDTIVGGVAGAAGGAVGGAVTARLGTSLLSFAASGAAAGGTYGGVDGGYQGYMDGRGFAAGAMEGALVGAATGAALGTGLYGGIRGYSALANQLRPVRSPVSSTTVASERPIPTVSERIEGVAQQAFDYAVDNPRMSGLTRQELGKDAHIQATRWLRRWAQRNDVPMGPGGLEFEVAGAHSIPDVVFHPTRQIFDFKLSLAALRPVQTQNILRDFPGYSLRYVYGPDIWR